MSVKIKPGAAFYVIAPAGIMILNALKETSKRLAVDLVITSGTDGMHSGPLDPHRSGEAYDIRSHDFDDQMKGFVLQTMMGLLGKDKFYGTLESAGEPNEHYHFQRKIGTRITVEDFLNG